MPVADVRNLQSSSILVSVFLFSFVLGKLNMSKDYREPPLGLMWRRKWLFSTV